MHSGWFSNISITSRGLFAKPWVMKSTIYRTVFVYYRARRKTINILCAFILENCVPYIWSRWTFFFYFSTLEIDKKGYFYEGYASARRAFLSLFRNVHPISNKVLEISFDQCPDYFPRFSFIFLLSLYLHWLSKYINSVSTRAVQHGINRNIPSKRCPVYLIDAR